MVCKEYLFSWTGRGHWCNGCERCGVGYAVCVYVYVCGGEGERLTRIMLSKRWYMWYYCTGNYF